MVTGVCEETIYAWDEDGNLHEMYDYEGRVEDEVADLEMQEKTVVVKNCDIGLGLFADEEMEDQTIIAVYRGERITYEEADRRERQRDLLGEKQDYMIDTGMYVLDATFVWNAARFANYSCSPNTYFEMVPLSTGEVVPDICANQKISRHTPITVDYCMVQKMRIKCRCMSRTCRGWLC